MQSDQVDALEVLASDVPLRDVARLLGYPRGRELDERVEASVEAARAWCVREARAWSAVQSLAIERIAGAVVEWRVRSSGARGSFEDRALARRLEATRADEMIAFACSAGAELEARVHELSAEEDALGAFVCDRFGAAWVEALVRRAGIVLGRGLAARGRSLLPPRSPGLEGWSLDGQAALFACFGGEIGPLVLLDSGMLRPLNSKLAVFGTTEQALPGDPAAWVPCCECTQVPCSHRRT